MRCFLFGVGGALVVVVLLIFSAILIGFQRDKLAAQEEIARRQALGSDKYDSEARHEFEA